MSDEERFALLRALTLRAFRYGVDVGRFAPTTDRPYSAFDTEVCSAIEAARTGGPSVAPKASPADDIGELVRSLCSK